MAWIERLVEAMDADEVLLGAHRAAVAALKKREAEEAALKQGMARFQRDRAEREKTKTKAGRRRGAAASRAGRARALQGRQFRFCRGVPPRLSGGALL